MSEYLTSIKIEAYISNLWTDISSYVVSSLEGESGIYSNDYDNRLASNGSLRFDMNNVSGNWTPSDTFQKGTLIKVTAKYNYTEKVKFYGRIDSIKIDEGTLGEQRVHIEALDWMDVAQNQIIRVKAAQTNKRIDEAVTSLLSDIPIRPEATDLNTGDNTFLSVFDSIAKNSTYYSELNNLVMSELSYAYLRDGGQTLKVEANSTRNIKNLSTYKYISSLNEEFIKNDAGDGFLLGDSAGKLKVRTGNYSTFTPTFDRTFEDLNILHGKNILNEVAFTVYPRRLGGSIINLFKFDIANGQTPIKIASLTSYTINGTYTDSNSIPVAGYDIVTPVITTDYLFNSKSDGTGTNLSANLTVTFSSGADGFTVTYANTGAEGFLTKSNVRGKAIYKDNPIESIGTDTNSQNQFGVKSIAIRQPYEQTPDNSIIEEAKILDDEKNPRNIVISAKFNANVSQTNMDGFMFTDIGDLTYIKSTKPAIDSYFYIQGKKYKIDLDGNINYEMILKDTYSFNKGLSPIGVRFSGYVDSKNAISWGKPPQITNLIKKTYSLWIYMRNGPSSAPLLAKFTSSSGDSWWLQWPTTTGLMDYSRQFSTGTNGQWRLSANPFAGLADKWIHLALTYDAGDVNNDPVFYVNGVSKAFTELSTPVGTVVDDSNAIFTMGNRNYPGDELNRNLNGYLKDVRIYNRILSSTEINTIVSGENDYSTVPDGLVFQAFGVKTEELNDYIGQTIYPSMKLIDNIYGIRGTTTFDTSSTNNYMSGVDPTSTSLP